MKAQTQLWLVAASLLGCATPPTVAAPVDLEVTASLFDSGTLYLQWTPAPSIDRYEVEQRTGSSPWVRLDTEPIDGWANGVGVPIAPTTPELTVVEFRLRAFRGTAYGYSNVAAYRMPINPAAVVTADLKGFTVEVRWINQSAAATTVVLERSTDGNAAGRTWVPVALPVGATDYADTDLRGLASVRYRVTYGAEGYWSEARESYTIPIRLAAPTNVQVSAAGGVLTLSWTNNSPSATANEVELLEDNGLQDPVELEPTATAWTLPEGTHWPTLRLRVAAKGPGLPAWSDMVSVLPFTIAGPLTLRASVASLPQEPLVARDATGRYVATTTAWPLRVCIMNGTTCAGHPLDAAWVAESGVALAGPGFAHVGKVIRRSIGTRDAFDMARDVWDGSTWSTEIIAEDASWGVNWARSIGYGFWLGASGLQQAIWKLSSGDLKHALRSGSWVTSTVPASTIAPTSTRVSFGPDGTSYVLRMGATACVLQTRSTSGVWSELTVDACALLGPIDDAWLAGANDGAAVIMLSGHETVDGVSHQGLWLVQVSKTAASEPELVAHDATGMALAVRSDAARPVAAALVDDGGPWVRLFARTAVGVESMALGRGAPYGVNLGYAPNNKLWCAVEIYDATADDDALFREASFVEL